MNNEGASLRIASGDKRFVVAYQLWHNVDARPLLKISGPEFPGIERSEKRPVYIVPPEFSHWYSFKGVARRIIEWGLSEDHVVERVAYVKGRDPW